MTHVPPLRLRFLSTPKQVWDLAFSFEDVADDPNPPSLCQIAPSADGVDEVDVEDPTNPDFEYYPWGVCADVTPGGFVRHAASHWQRVHPRMQRFTETELGQAEVMAGLGNLRGGLQILVEARHGACEFVEQQLPDWESFV